MSPRLRKILGASRRLASPLWSEGRALSGMRNYTWFWSQFCAYRRMGGSAALAEAFPQLSDRTATTPFDPHYFFQAAWAARRIAEAGPAEHVDVGSRVDFVGQLTALTRVTFVDVRPLTADLENLVCIEGSVIRLPFADRSLQSVSCLHVAEHIGLGRYGDPLDPSGTVKAAAELERVVMEGGQLLLSLPVGRPRTAFNAHRIHDPYDVVAMFPDMRLVEFAGVDDRGEFRRPRELDELRSCDYGCGMFCFVR